MPSALKTLIVETLSDNILEDYHNSKYAVAPFPLVYITSTWEPLIVTTKPITFSYSPIQFHWPENHIYYHPTIGEKIDTDGFHYPIIKSTEPSVATTELETTTLETTTFTESQSVAFAVEDVGSRKVSKRKSRSFQISFEIIILFLCSTI